MNTPRLPLVELLVVIGTIALLISILLPALAKAREAANRAVCLSILHQQYITNQMYALDNRGAIPIGHNYCKGMWRILGDNGTGTNPPGAYPNLGAGEPGCLTNGHSAENASRR